MKSYHSILAVLVLFSTQAFAMEAEETREVKQTKPVAGAKSNVGKAVKSAAPKAAAGAAKTSDGHGEHDVKQ